VTAGFTATDPFAGFAPTPLSMVTPVALLVCQVRFTELPGATVVELAVNESTEGAGPDSLGPFPTPLQPLNKSAAAANNTVNNRSELILFDVRSQHIGPPGNRKYRPRLRMIVPITPELAARAAADYLVLYLGSRYRD